MRIPAASGRSLALTVGTEELYHGDIDIEIAEGSVIGRPRLLSAFQGLVVRATPRRGLGGISLDLEALGELLVDDGLSTTDVGGDSARALTLGNWRSCRVSESVSLPTEGTSRPMVFGNRYGLHVEVELR